MMNPTTKRKYLTSATRLIIALLMLGGFSLDGCQGNDALFMAATLLWIYQSDVVRIEAAALRLLRRCSPRRTDGRRIET